MRKWMQVCVSWPTRLSGLYWGPYFIFCARALWAQVRVVAVGERLLNLGRADMERFVPISHPSGETHHRRFRALLMLWNSHDSGRVGHCPVLQRLILKGGLRRFVRFVPLKPIRNFSLQRWMPSSRTLRMIAT